MDNCPLSAQQKPAKVCKGAQAPRRALAGLACGLLPPSHRLTTQCWPLATLLAQEAQRSKIIRLLEGRWFVPVLESEDSLSTVGKPWSPDVSRAPTSPVVALAGPMSLGEATVLHENWTASPSATPRRQSRAGGVDGLTRRVLQMSVSSGSTPPPLAGAGRRLVIPSAGNSPVATCPELVGERKQFYASRRSDSHKGWEQYGRVLARRFRTGWEEYWPFLECL